MSYDQPDTPAVSKEVYLGDGVYASTDGYHIWLKTKAAYGVAHMIALDRDVYRALVEYAKTTGHQR